MSFVDDVKIEPVPAKRRVKSDTSKNIEKNELKHKLELTKEIDRMLKRKAIVAKEADDLTVSIAYHRAKFGTDVKSLNDKLATLTNTFRVLEMHLIHKQRMLEKLR